MREKIWFGGLFCLISLATALKDDIDKLVLESECLTLAEDTDSRAKLNLPCVFPFIYKDTVFTGCTNLTDPEGKVWCATAIHEGTNNYISGSGNYGHCNPACPVYSNIEERSTSGLAETNRRCPTGETCVKTIKCERYKTLKREFNGIRRGTTRYNTLLYTLLGMVCNKEEEGVCCPEENNVALFSNSGVCLQPNSCKSRFQCQKVQDLWDEGTSSAIEEIKALKFGCGSDFCCPPESSCTAGTDLTDPTYLPDYSSVTRECGTTQDTSRITGGETTKIGTYPSAALLGYEATVKVVDPFKRGKFQTLTKIKFTCGGTLITRWYVVTAAHCDSSRLNKVVLGDWDTAEDPDCSLNGDCQPPRQIFHIQARDKMVHEDYGRVNQNVLNDIMLIKLPRMAELNSAVQLACLPTDPIVAARELATQNLRDGFISKRPIVVGWGYTDGDPLTQKITSDFKEDGSGSASQVQQALDVPVRPSSVCRDVGFSIDENSQICAGGEKGKDSCKGDSGGPLYASKFSPKTNLVEPGNIWYLYGLVSFGARRCGNGTPAVYTRLEYFVPWIKRKIRNC